MVRWIFPEPKKPSKKVKKEEPKVEYVKPKPKRKRKSRKRGGKR